MNNLNQSSSALDGYVDCKNAKTDVEQIDLLGTIRANTSTSSLESFSKTNDREYGATDLRLIHEIGKREFDSNDPRYKRKTFALRLAYDGTHYSGFQRQKGD
jgi:hypothetical protein